MRSTGSKSSTPNDEKPADSSEISPAIAVDPTTGAMRDVQFSPAPLGDLSGLAAEPPVEFSHRTGAYGATILTTLDHCHARATHVNGDVVEYASRLRGPDGNPEEPSAFAKAIAEAKDRWKVAYLQGEREREEKRKAAIQAATAKNRGAK
jgi:hypothetical protein